MNMLMQDHRTGTVIAIDANEDKQEKIAETYFAQVKEYQQAISLGKTPSAGLDIVATEDAVILPGESVMISTGLRMSLPSGYRMQISARSGLAAKYGIQTMAGVIDNEYRGEIKVILCRFKVQGKDNEPYHIKAGDRIAQGIFHKMHNSVLDDTMVIMSEELPDMETDRGSKGFGSSGR